MTKTVKTAKNCSKIQLSICLMFSVVKITNIASSFDSSLLSFNSIVLLLILT